jgi:hypothetical protein
MTARRCSSGSGISSERGNDFTRTSQDFPSKARASDETPNFAVLSVGAKLGKPDGAIWPGREELWDVRSRWERELAELTSWSHAPDQAFVLAALSGGAHCGKPESTIWPTRNAERVALAWGQWELTDVTSRGGAPDLAVLPGGVHIKPFSEPHIAIRPGCDVDRLIIGGEERELADMTSRGDAPDQAIELDLAELDVDESRFGKPEVAVRPGGDADRVARWCGERELTDVASRGDAPDLVVFGKPEVAVRPGRDADR